MGLNKDQAEQLIYYKKTYNSTLKRVEDAIQFFEKSSVEECLKYLELYNSLVRNLSKLIYIIEEMTGGEMPHEIRIEGFKEVRN